MKIMVLNSYYNNFHNFWALILLPKMISLSLGQVPAEGIFYELAVCCDESCEEKYNCK